MTDWGGAWTKEEKKETKGWKRGQYRARWTTIEGKKVWAIQWQDRKLVSFLSTVESKVAVVTRKTVNPVTRVYEPMELWIPTIISAYNFGKVGTDRMDQKVGTYYRNSRYRWHVKCLLHIFYISLNNAHITYLELTKQTTTKYPLKTFYKAVIAEWIAKQGRRRPPTPSKTHKHHTPTMLGRRPTGVARDPKRDRTSCRECQAQCYAWCAECEVPLHINTVHTGKTCWSDFHSKLN